MILSIESSCDDSSIAITEITTARLIAHKKLSQEQEHSRYGGVVPEIASRLHTESLPLVLGDIKQILGGFDSLKAIAVTTQPGLSVSLMGGLMMAKALSLSLEIPLISINHLIGHFYSLFINQDKCIFPMSVLLVSGGHTLIIEAESKLESSAQGNLDSTLKSAKSALDSTPRFKIIAQSMDDSFGESFDKVAKMLGLSYPGGPIIEQYARYNQKEHIALPLPLKHSKTLAFSFSGLKNATRLAIQEGLDSNHTLQDKDFIAQICASFQDRAIAHICDKLESYFKMKQVQNFAIVGGASANLELRERVSDLARKYHIKLFLAPLEFCADNAAMIGRAGIEAFKMRHFSDPLTLDVSPKSTAPFFE